MASIASNIGSGRPLRSASTIVASTESGQHLLKIDGYSRTKDVPTGKYIKSRPFRVRGHAWHISFYPNGCDSDSVDYISFFLWLERNVAQGVGVQFGFSLLDHVGNPVPSYTNSSSKVQIHSGRGYPSFIKRDELENSEHLRNDRFIIRCDVKVFKELQMKDIDVDDIAPPPSTAVVVPVPPSDLHHHFGGLLMTAEGADVTFIVDDKTFAAHRCVLAARSSVFRAELFSTEKEGADVVRVDDMEAQDFEALLCYMYTDSLPEIKGGEAAAMLPDLAAVANRYKMERLRLVCEEKLCEYVNSKTVSAILAFAGEHHCHILKEKCLQFLDNPANLRAVMEADGLEHLSKSCPYVLKELVAKLAAAPYHV